MEASFTGVVPPCQLNSVHKEHLLLTIDDCIQAHTAQVAELGVEKYLADPTITEAWTGWLREMLSGNHNF